MILIAGLSGGLIAAGVVMMIRFFRPPTPKRLNAAPRLPLSRRWRGLSRETRTSLIVGVVIGFVVAIVTSIPLMAVVIPAAFVGLPLLLGKPSTRDRDLILALESWSRALASTANTGAFTLHDVIGITRATVPSQLRGPVDRLYARMSSSWSTTNALRAFAGELDSAYADEVVVYLVQAAQFNAGGLYQALSSVADSLAEYGKLRIDLQVERDKPRRTLQFMTGLVAVVLAGIVLFAGVDQLSFYKTPAGTIVLAVIIASFVGLLMWARKLSRVVPESRIILTDTPIRQNA